MDEMKIVDRVTTRQAAMELNMDLDTLQYMMKAQRLPIGEAIKKDGKKRYSFYIYRGLLDNYKSYLNGMSATDRNTALYGSPVEDNDERQENC